MKLKMCVLISLMLLGCSPSKVWLYRSVPEEGRQELRYNGISNVSYGGSIGKGAYFSITAGSRDKKDFGISLWVAVEKGTQLDIDEWTIGLSSPNFLTTKVVPIKELKVSVYGRNGKPGHYEFARPGKTIVGKGLNEEVNGKTLDSYVATMEINVAPPEELAISLPTFRVSGKKIRLPEIDFKLIEKVNFPYSLQ